MEIIKEKPVENKKVLKNTLVKGRDGQFYLISLVRLYDFEVKGFALYEISVSRSDPEGNFQKLVQPYLKRYNTEEEALNAYSHLLQNFDAEMDLPEAKT